MNTLTAVQRATIKAVVTILSLALSIVGLGVISTSASSAQGTTTTSVTTRWSPDRYETRVRYWINRKRGYHDLVPLKAVRCANRTASRWTNHLVDTDEFYHQDMGNVLRKCDAFYAGETLGRGGISPRVLVNMWMNSPEHRAIVLSTYPRRVGIGATVDSHGQWLTTANFVKR